MFLKQLTTKYKHDYKEHNIFYYNHDYKKSQCCENKLIF